MAAYNITFKPSVHKDLRYLPKNVVRSILTRINRLKTESFPAQTIKLSGAERLYRIRVGDYRIIYEVNTAGKTIMIHYVRHRREAYRDL